MNALDAAYSVAAAVAAPWWMRKARGDWPERFGRTAALPEKTEGRPRVLLHAVSVGEVNAIRGLVPLLRERGAEVVVSVGTDTGITRARELFAPRVALVSDQCNGTDGNRSETGSNLHRSETGATIVRYPLDFSRCVRRFLDAVRPDVVGLVELELWPNFVAECSRRGVPVCVINGRLSERSFRGYRRVRPLIGRTFARLAHAGVQDEAYRARFVAMGVPEDRCTVTGSMKWDAAAMVDEVVGVERLALELGIDRTRPVVVGGSTAPLGRGRNRTMVMQFDNSAGLGRLSNRGVASEEELLDLACPEGAQLLCAPRRPEWFDEAYAALGGEKRCARRSRPASRAPGRERFLLDTIGELRTAYSLADVVVVGRSFGELYGSDPIEPIALGKATVIGPAVKDFESIVGEFEQAGGIVRTTAAELPRVLAELLADPERRRALAERGRACIREHQGATRRHAELLLSMVTVGRREAVAAMR